MSDPTVDALDLLNRISLYANAVDGQQWHLFDQIFAEDVVAEYDPYRFSGLAEFKSGAEAAWKIFDTCQHAMLNTTWTVDGDEAKTLTYGSWILVRHKAGGEPIWEGRGWYDDQWRRGPSGWRVVHRRCEVTWSRGNLRVAAPAFADDGPAVTNPLFSAIAEGRVGFYT